MIKSWLIILITVFLLVSITVTSVKGDEENERNNAGLILTAPLRTGTNNLLHSLILIPPLESAELMEIGKGYIHAGLDYAVGNFKKENGPWFLDYDANLTELFVDVRYGVSKTTEFKAGLTSGVLAEDKRELVLLNGNLAYFSGNRDIGLSDLYMGLKFRLMGSPNAFGEAEGLPYTGSLSLQLKYPLAEKEDVLSSGGTDLSIAYVETDKITENTFVHTQIGVILTGEATVFDESLSISNPIFYGAGISSLVTKDTALIGQIQGNLNAFREIKVLNKNPLSVQGGFRYTPDSRFFTEGSIGFGLNSASSDFTMMFSLGSMF